MTPDDGRGAGLLEVLGELGFDGATYPGLLRGLALLDPEQPALSGESERVSYGELLGRVGATAAHLREAGVDAGDQVAVMLPNSIGTVVTHLAVQTVGAVGVLVNTSLFGEALRHLLDHSTATTVITTSSLSDAVADVVAQVPAVRQVLVSDRAATAAALEGSVDPGPALDDRHPSPIDPAFINYTSGTTGRPKGVVLKHVFSAGAIVVARRLGLRPNAERLYVCTPMYHALGLAMTAMGLRLGAELVIAPSFSASRYWDDIRRHRCTFAYHVGTMAQMVYNQPRRPTDGEHELRAFMGGGMPADIWENFARRFGVEIIESYSASDGVGAISNWGAGPVGSFGRPDPELEARVVDAGDRAVPVGTVGELHLRPAGGGLGGPAVEYFGDADGTADKNLGGWVRTGDLVRQDEDGYLFFVDRMKDVIRRRGVNVAPAEIERIVCGHPDVRECAALAVPAELGEDEIKLVVVGTDLEPHDLRHFAEKALPAHMRPRYFEIVGELPKTVTERVQRYKLKGSWLTAGTWDAISGEYVQSS